MFRQIGFGRVIPVKVHVDGSLYPTANKKQINSATRTLVQLLHKRESTEKCYPETADYFRAEFDKNVGDYTIPRGEVDSKKPIARNVRIEDVTRFIFTGQESEKLGKAIESGNYRETANDLIYNKNNSRLRKMDSFDPSAPPYIFDESLEFSEVDLVINASTPQKKGASLKLESIDFVVQENEKAEIA